MARIPDWSDLDSRAQARRREASRAHASALAPLVNAFVEITPSAPSRAPGPLGGLPYAAKDMFRAPTREPGCGVGFASGIEGFSDPLERFTDAGADLVGFTCMTELAYEPSGFNATSCRVRNPWNLDFIAGGSSSGSAAAVASGAVVAALGSDIGGSLRIPAHACGVTAWKPSHGLVSTRGAMPLAPTLDAVGLLGRSAGDLLLLTPYMGLSATAEASRRAIVADDVAAESDPAIQRCLAEAVGAIEAAGVAVERRPALRALEAIDRHALIVLQGESARRHRPALENETLAPALRRRLEKGLEISDETLAASVNARDRLVQEFDEQVLPGSDVLILPVMPIVTPTADRCDPTSDCFSARTLYALSRWTRFVNMLGFPAVAMPAGFDDNGMPVGIQIVGRAGADFALLDLARRVQAITSWHARVPHAVAHLIPQAELVS
jgi:aspartyl-tRNA(Asn)/glutamyl-tRNA(Gln) amidotransferase subunit A